MNLPDSLFSFKWSPRVIELCDLESIVNFSALLGTVYHFQILRTETTSKVRCCEENAKNYQKCTRIRIWIHSIQLHSSLSSNWTSDEKPMILCQLILLLINLVWENPYLRLWTLHTTESLRWYGQSCPKENPGIDIFCVPLSWGKKMKIGATVVGIIVM